MSTLCLCPITLARSRSRRTYSACPFPMTPHVCGPMARGRMTLRGDLTYYNFCCLPLNGAMHGLAPLVFLPPQKGAIASPLLRRRLAPPPTGRLPRYTHPPSHLPHSIPAMTPSLSPHYLARLTPDYYHAKINAYLLYRGRDSHGGRRPIIDGPIDGPRSDRGHV